MLWFIPEYILLVVATIEIILCSTAASVHYPSSRSTSCRAGRACVLVTSCPKVLSDIKRRRGNPRVCGWTESEEPMVCCPRYRTTTEAPTLARPKIISHLSPKACGRKNSFEPEAFGGAVIHQPSLDEILDGGIVPRTQESTFNTDIPPMFDEPRTSRQYTVGGVEASKIWPWMVAIFYGKSKKQLCGGTLIDDRHIITAAHCFAGKSLNPEMYRVQVGILKLDEGNVDLNVQDIKLHEGYQPRYYYDDIAIMRLPFTLSTDFNPACLPADDMVQVGDNVTVLGWGDLSFGGVSTTKLQEVEGIPIVSNAQCNAQFKKLPGLPFPRGILDTFICAGLEEGGKDACQGDSGGPLLYEHAEGLWSLVGVVSFGYKCGEPGFSGAYTRVSSYLQWIENYIRSQNEVAVEKHDEPANFDYFDDKPLWRSLPEKVIFPV